MTIQEFRDYMASGKPVVGGGDVHMMFHKPKGRFFWFIFGLVFCQPLLIRNQKNRPFGLFISPLKSIAPV